MDPETTSFLTQMRDSIEGKIDASSREGREALHRVETSVSALSREIGETSTALRNHVTEDEKIHKGLEDDIHECEKDSRSKLEKIMPTATTATLSGLVIGILEWFRSSGHS